VDKALKKQRVFIVREKPALAYAGAKKPKESFMNTNDKLVE